MSNPDSDLQPQSDPNPPLSIVPESKTDAPIMAPPRLLICGLGNPGAPYATTLHSAGLVFIKALSRTLNASTGDQTPFSKSRAMGNGLIRRYQFSDSTGQTRDWTLYQSTDFMNDSGRGVKAAWNEVTRLHNAEGGDSSARPRLVVVHDEMREDSKPFGTLSVRLNAQKLSPRGHNGIKSVIQHMSGSKDMDGKGWVKVGINIGRPQSRDSSVVADYVLKKMSTAQVAAVEAAAERFGDEIVRCVDR